jgi:hypothetical protein
MEIAGLLNDRLPGIFLPLIQFPATRQSLDKEVMGLKGKHLQMLLFLQLIAKW